jgi:hypothetical protein
MLDSVTGIEFPFLQHEVEDMFGDPRDPDFQNEWLGFIDLAEFADMLGQVKDFHHPSYFGFYGHYLLEHPLKKALGLVREKGQGKIIQTFDGCHCIRPSKSGKFTSMHAWGLAVDLNAASNPYSESRLITTFPDAFVACFTQAGFEWGGLWQSPHDAMHFQLPWTRAWTPGAKGILTPVPFVRDGVKDQAGAIGQDGTVSVGEGIQDEA